MKRSFLFLCVLSEFVFCFKYVSVENAGKRVLKMSSTTKVLTGYFTDEYRGV